MRLGDDRKSAIGDAVLTVADGSFVDAYNEDSVGLSDSAAKVDRWLENGLSAVLMPMTAVVKLQKMPKRNGLQVLIPERRLWLAVKQVKFRLIKMQLRLMPMMVIADS